MTYRLDISGRVRNEILKFIEPEVALLRDRDHLDVHVGCYTDQPTGRDTIRVIAYDYRRPVDDTTNRIEINSITVDPYRRHGLHRQLTEFANTVKNQLKLML